jgi:hypothetical protein
LLPLYHPDRLEGISGLNPGGDYDFKKDVTNPDKFRPSSKELP